MVPHLRELQNIYGIYLQNCCADDKDYVELGGSSSLDSRRLKTKETFCGCDRRRMRSRGLTVLCESSTVRLVSSGQHRNSVTVFARAAGAEDLVSSNISNNLFIRVGMESTKFGSCRRRWLWATDPGATSSSVRSFYEE